MSPIKNVWYEVRYVDSIPLSIIGSSGPVQSVIRCKNFKDRKKLNNSLTSFLMTITSGLSYVKSQFVTLFILKIKFEVYYENLFY